MIDRQLPWLINDQTCFSADNGKVGQLLGWERQPSKEDDIESPTAGK